MPPPGAHFHRCALQVNPHSYADQFRGQKLVGDGIAHAQAMVCKAQDLGISVLGITDHSNASSVDRFRTAAQGTEVTILPGFELTSSEGIHILCLYEPDIDVKMLERFLGAFEVPVLDATSTPIQQNFKDVLFKVREQGGIGIAAHVTGNKGLLTALKGEAAIHAWHSSDLLAIQIPGSVADLTERHRQIVENRNLKYRKSRAAGENLAVAVVNAKDVVEPRDLAQPRATCWIKMSEVSIEGLRQAFLDPDSRIRLHSDAPPEVHVELHSIEWLGGYLDGTKIYLNPNLNVLIGGRGVGKSTVVESLRYALAIEPVGEQAKRVHANLIGQVLRPGTKVSLRVKSVRPEPRLYVVERTVNNPPVVRDEHGGESSLRPCDILPGIEVYGQNEIAELVQDPGKRTRLLNRFRPQDESLADRKDELMRELHKTRHSLLALHDEIRQVDGKLAGLPALEESLARYQQAGLEDQLRNRSLFVQEEKLFESVPDRVRVFKELLEMLRPELPLDLTFLAFKAISNLPGARFLADVESTLRQLSADLTSAQEAMESALERADRDIGNVLDAWTLHKQAVEADYQKALRSLQDAAVDGDEFIRIKGAVEDLRPLEARRTQIGQLERELEARRSSLWAEWEQVKDAEFGLLNQAAREVNARLKNRVKVAVTPAGDREPLVEFLRDRIGGRLQETVDMLMSIAEFSLADFVRCCREGAAALQEEYSLTDVQAQSLAGASPAVLMELEELKLPATTEICLNTVPDGNKPIWREMNRLSTGQKATAVVLLLLLDSDAPLILDQPEDDLDNRFITDVIVPSMRRAKRKRQFVFTTHNANIPVLGDAELIVGLSPSDRDESDTAEIKSNHVGSVDTDSVRELVGEILEGGRDAFETRRLKYGY
jgi:hypothetical protein